MVEPIPGLPDNVLGLRAHGTVTMDDFEQVIAPAIEKATAGGRKIRVLFQMTPKFDGYSAGAVVEDAKIGFKYVGSLERCAIVSDVDWINSAIKMFGFAIPCPIKVFPNTDLAGARSWIAEAG